MVKVGFDLVKMLSPLELSQFFTEYWEQNLLFIPRNEPDFYAELLTFSDLDKIISSYGLRYPSFRLVKTGTSIPPSSYTYNLPWGGDSFTRQIDTEALFSEYRKGATVVIQALHSNWVPLALFCRNLEMFFNCPVQTNIYLTPKHSQGFAAHYDTHDVFVLQVSGSKRWRIYEGPVHLPDRSQPFKSDLTKPGKLLLDQVLNAGDMLYLPRGFIHEGLTSDNDSLHITAGIIAYTWLDIFSEAVALCKEDAEFRRSLPPGFALNPEETGPLLSSRFPGLLQKFNDASTLDKLVERITERFIDTRRPILDGQLNQLRAVESLDEASLLERRPGILYRVLAEQDSVSLIYNGKKITFPGYVEPALQFILRQESNQFKVSALPGGLDIAGKLVMVRRLVREGFLVLG